MAVLSLDYSVEYPNENQVSPESLKAVNDQQKQEIDRWKEELKLTKISVADL